ncbi:MAG TPA: hypothetical protein H9689_07290, partial [Firmicutes bacterium]|nr:hypothetical protein [Bacillota bacterium]
MLYLQQKHSIIFFPTGKRVFQKPDFIAAVPAQIKAGSARNRLFRLLSAVFEIFSRVWAEHEALAAYEHALA